MLFAISCIDRRGGADIRKDKRDAHLSYLRAHADQVMAAGPYLSEAGDDMVGSLLIMEFPDLTSARAFTQNDPYGMAGLFESVDVRPWKKVMPAD